MLAISPHYASDHTLFAGTQEGRLFKSTDRGDAWEEIPSGSSRAVTTIGLSPEYPYDPTMIVGHLEDNLFLTQNDGRDVDTRHAISVAMVHWRYRVLSPIR